MAVISAQVIVKPGHSEAAREVTLAFSRAGFQVGPLVGNNFSITAPASKFGTDTVGRGEMSDSALEQFVLQSLDSKIRDAIEAIVFPKPPDFGPGGSY